MSDTPETLAAILADYRADIPAMTIGKLPHPTPEYLRILLDRIEAAAKRRIASLNDALAHCREFAKKIERENEEGETRLDAEEIIATVDNEFAGIRPERAPGNAAAMREALEQALAYCESDQKSGIAYSDNDVLVPMLRAAIAAPARNCDRPECADVESAWATYCAETNRADCKGFARWLFARAEGGDHA